MVQAYEDGQILCAACPALFLADERPGTCRVIRRPERGRPRRARAVRPRTAFREMR